MSDMSQGPGWWQASDGKWYPPEQSPGTPPPAAPGAGYGAPVVGPGAIVGTGSAHGQLAEWPQRVVAFLLDIVCLLPLVIIQVIFSQISTALGLLVNLVVTAAALYFGYLNGATGQSPGKALTGLKVVSDNTGQVIGGGPGVIRQLAHFIDSFICFLGYFLPLVDAKKQTLADKVMGTVVITGAEKKPFGPEIFKAE